MDDDGEDDGIRTLSCSREHKSEKRSSYGDMHSTNCIGSVGSVPGRFEPSNTQVKSKSLVSIIKSIEGHVPFPHPWTGVLVALCVIATLLDPLFCYILVVNEDRNCIGFDDNLRVAIVVLRSLIDFGYIILVISRFHIGHIPSSNAKKGRLRVAVGYLFSYFTVDILAVIPVAQVVILIVIPTTEASHFTTAIRLMQFVLVIQYFPRVFRVYAVVKKVRWTSKILRNSAGAKAIFNLFLYMIASHVFGAFWYLFSVERRATCLQERCHSHPYCHKSYNNSSVERSCMDACSAKASSNDTTAFNFGIFDDAFKTGIVYSADFIGKFSYCYWWGLQNLSSLGQGLKPSTYVWEIYFAVFIIISGLVLFALLLGNLQTFLQATFARQEEMRLKGRDIELWTQYHSLPPDLRNRIKDYQNYQWKTTGGVDVGNILRNLPRDLRRATTRHLCSDAIKRVSLFQNTDEKFLDAVYGSLKPTLYIEHNSIVREGDPLDEMIFIIRGKLWIYSNSNRDGETSDSSRSLLEGDFFGEDLLNWVLKNPVSSIFPISTKTVSTCTKVEAFVISANDLKNVVSKFWWRLSRERRNDPNFKELWALWAALALQAAWRRYKSKREKKKAQLGLATESGNSQPSVTTNVHATRFIARALHALNRRLRKGRDDSNDLQGPSEKNDLPEPSNV